MFFSILAIYGFVLIGLLAKYFFKEKMDENSILILSVYFFQPILAFWGLSVKPIDMAFAQVGFWFFAFALFLGFVCFFLSKLFFKDATDRYILTAGAILGNTGNLGIPLGIAIFGPESIIYTSLIALCNILLVQTVGVYLYSRGNFTIKQSLINIFKLPVIWVSAVALILNLSGVVINENIFRSIEMGAHTALVLQLLTFGVFLYSIKIKTIEYKSLFFMNIFKFVVSPAIMIFALGFIGLPPFISAILLFQLTVPLAVNNINYAALYNSQPTKVAILVLSSSAIFMGYVFVMIELIEKYLK